jgi:hypothetical protein
MNEVGRVVVMGGLVVVSVLEWRINEPVGKSRNQSCVADQ